MSDARHPAAPLVSGIYDGIVTHNRLRPTPHLFRQRLFMMYLDLAELPAVFAGCPGWSTSRPALAWLRRADYHGDPAIPLDTAVRDAVARHTGRRPGGPIRMLTHLRYFGHSFNPVTFYYCFDAAGKRLESVLSEITNTPWRERHAYLVQALPAAGTVTGTFAKRFHVSPFMDIGLTYDWRFDTPGERLAVHMTNLDADGPLFHATLALKRAPITAANLARRLLAYPFMTLQVVAGIYWQALRLRLKGLTVYPHPPATVSMPTGGDHAVAPPPIRDAQPGDSTHG